MDKDIELIRKEYKRQKKLEQIVTSRVLVRPKTKKWQVTACFVILPFLLFGEIYFLTQLSVEIYLKIIFCVLSVFFILEAYLRFCLIMAVKCYQARAKDKTRKTCKCIPSCSEYAIICFKRIFPLTLALLKIRKRLYVTCNGEEYKVDFPTRKMGEKFENEIW